MIVSNIKKGNLKNYNYRILSRNNVDWTLWAHIYIMYIAFIITGHNTTGLYNGSSPSPPCCLVTAAFPKGGRMRGEKGVRRAGMKKAFLPKLPVGLWSATGRMARPEQCPLIASQVISNAVELVNSRL